MPVLDFAGFERRLAQSPLSAGGTDLCIPATDGTELAARLFRPDGDFADILVIYHGGGVNMAAGYDRLAADLVRIAPLAVCLVDIRGHGASAGPRGDAPSPATLWLDIDDVAMALMRMCPGCWLHLGGHSSGAGLLLNYATHHKLQAQVASLVFLAPEFGFRARLHHTDRPAGFSRARLWPFLLNTFSGGRLGGHIPAVGLDFSGSAAAKTLGCVSRYSVNMALALTPSDPIGQFARLDLPAWVGIAGDDELTDTARLEAFLTRHAPANVTWTRLARVSHLGAILDGAGSIAAALPLR